MSRTVLIVEGHAKYFCWHRLPWAQKAQAEGYDVHVTALKTGEEELVRQQGFPIHPISDGDRGRNPLSELGVFVKLVRLLRRLDPAVAHFITLRSVLYGSTAARLVGVPAVLNSVTGLGFLFVDDSLKTRFLRWAVLQALRLGFGHSNQLASFENLDDAALFASRGIVPEEEIIVTSGSGVDPEQFPAVGEAEVGDDGPLVMLPTRLLWQKGVKTFVKAARHLQSNEIPARFVIVGDTDLENPASVPKEQIKEWSDSGLVEWWGYRDREVMPKVLQRAHVVCLPSYYREGVPMVLLEAASIARPIVTTDVPGCREIVTDGKNGFLVPPHDPEALADRIHTLLNDAALRREMGRRGRQRVEDRFTADRVATTIVNAYNRLSDEAPAAVSSNPPSSKEK